MALSSSVFAEPVTIVALGDSLTAGYGLADQNDGLVPQLQAWLKAKGADVVVQNAGVSGDTTAGGLSRGGLGAGARGGRDDRDAWAAMTFCAGLTRPQARQTWTAS